MATDTSAQARPRGYSSPETERKMLSLFKGLVVNKAVASMSEVSRLPRFISEYLVARMCPDGSLKGYRRLVEFVRRYYPDPRDRDKYLHDLMIRGSIRLIDEVKVETDIKRGRHKAIIPCLGIRDADVEEAVLEENENLLRAGMWGVVELSYRHGGDPPVVVTGFTPFQVSRVCLDEFIEARRSFTLEEWVEVLLNTIGLNPHVYPPKARLLVLARLVPLVECNVNLAEFGPRATGKTFIYRNVSYYVRVVSGGRVSPATLFYNISTKAIGLIGVKDVVVFDEVNRVSFVNEDEVVGKLKDYMESGMFERGPRQAHSDCSLVFIGNTSDDVLCDPVRGLMECLPRFMRDPALLDRVHGLIPGWRLPKIRVSSIHLSRGYGLVADYFAEILHELRKLDFQRVVAEHVELLEGFTIRDEKAVRRLASGLLKLLCPHGEFDRGLLSEVLGLAVELRSYVRSLLSSMLPEEYPRSELRFRVRG